MSVRLWRCNVRMVRCLSMLRAFPDQLRIHAHTHPVKRTLPTPPPTSFPVRHVLLAAERRPVGARVAKTLVRDQGEAALSAQREHPLVCAPFLFAFVAPGSLRLCCMAFITLFGFVLVSICMMQRHRGPKPCCRIYCCPETGCGRAGAWWVVPM